MSVIKSTSTALSLISVVIMLIYTYNLLLFIKADNYIWSLWAISMLMSVSTSLISLWARDEYYRDQFEKVLMGVKL